MQLYISQYAHTSVKEHVLTVIQSNFTQLKWSRYAPTISDMELMLKVSWKTVHLVVNIVRGDS